MTFSPYVTSTGALPMYFLSMTGTSHTYPAKKAYKHSPLNRMIKIPTNAVLIPPRSAFGGQAIKRTNYFIESDYTRKVEDSGHDIDYVIFKQKSVITVIPCFFDPSLVIASWANHSLVTLAVYPLGLKVLSALRKTRLLIFR